MIKPRDARPTLNFIDEYCASYRDIFPEVRSFEAFKQLHLGIISDIQRKTLPAIAKVAGLDNEQSLHHFLTQSPWDVCHLRSRRLELVLKTLKGRKIVLIIDETGDQKKGKKTDYVSRQYIGKLGKIENGLVAVVAYGLIDGITFPLMFEVYKPKERLKPGEVYRTKPQIAVELIRQVKKMGFEIERVLADSLYGESGSIFIAALEELELPYVVAIRSNHGVWLTPEQSVRANQWKKFDRFFSDGTQEVRFIREWIFGKRREKRYWEITTDKETLPENSTWYVMTHIPGLNYRDIGNFYGDRTWIEYGFKESKNELGWADFHFTHYADIEKWWEIVESAYLLVSFYTQPFQDESACFLNQSEQVSQKFSEHQQWDEKKGWKNILNNLRLILLPLLCFNLIKPWLKIFPIPQLTLGLTRLIALMDLFPPAIFISYKQWQYYFSSA